MAKTKLQCDSCKGSGLASRQGGDADKDLHPIISQSQGLCEKCGGSGIVERDITATAAAAQG